MVEELEETYDVITQVEMDIKDLWNNLDDVADKIRRIDTEKEEDFKIPEGEIDTLFKICKDMTDRISLLSESVDELTENIGKLRKIEILLKLKEEKSDLPKL